MLAVLWKDLVHEAPIISFDISPDDKRIASADTNGQIKIWTHEGELIKDLPSINMLKNIAFFKGGAQLVSISQNGQIDIWDQRGAPLHQFQIDASMNSFKTASITEKSYCSTEIAPILSLAIGKGIP